MKYLTIMNQKAKYFIEQYNSYKDIVPQILTISNTLLSVWW